MHFLSIFASAAPTLPLRQNNKPHCSLVFHCLQLSTFLVSLLNQPEPLDPRLFPDQNQSMDVGLSGLFLVLVPLGLACLLAICHHIGNLSFSRLLALESYLGDHHSTDCLCSNLYSFQLYHLLRYLSDQVVLEMGCVHTFETYRQLLAHLELHYSAWPFEQIYPYFRVYSSLAMVHYSTSPSMRTFRHFEGSAIYSIVFGVDLVLEDHPHCCSALPSEHIFQHVEVKLRFLMYLQDHCYFALPFTHTSQRVKEKL